MEFEYTEYSSNQKRLSMIEMCLNDIKEIFIGKSILDIGCGSGDYFVMFKKFGISLYTGIDISEKSIDAAKEHYSNVKFYRNDYLKQNFNEKFDFIFSESSIHYFREDISKIMNKIILELNPGGYIIITYGKKTCRSIMIIFIRKFLHISMKIFGDGVFDFFGKIVYGEKKYNDFVKDRLIYFKERPNLISKSEWYRIFNSAGLGKETISIKDIGRTSFIQVEHLLVIARKNN